MATSRRAALYVRVSTSDRGQTVENQLQPLQEAAGRLGWTVVAIYRDEGISGTGGRDNWSDHADLSRSGLDPLAKTFSFKTPQISSDSVLKPAIQHPRTHSRNPRLDCTGIGRVLGDF
jgi:hypothetical protein